MFLILLLKGILLGFAVAVPLDLNGVLCIRKSLELGFKGAFITGVGASLVDFCYACLAWFGMVIIHDFIIKYSNILVILGGCALILFGIKEFFSKVKLEIDGSSKSSILSVFFTSLLFGFINPLEILTYSAFFISINSIYSTLITNFILVIGICIGSLAWYCILGGVIYKTKHLVPINFLSKIKYFSAAILVSFGLYSIWPVMIKIL